LCSPTLLLVVYCLLLTRCCCVDCCGALFWLRVARLICCYGWLLIYGSRLLLFTFTLLLLLLPTIVRCWLSVTVVAFDLRCYPGPVVAVVVVTVTLLLLLLTLLLDVVVFTLLRLFRLLLFPRY